MKKLLFVLSVLSLITCGVTYADSYYWHIAWNDGGDTPLTQDLFLDGNNQYFVASNPSTRAPELWTTDTSFVWNNTLKRLEVGNISQDNVDLLVPTLDGKVSTSTFNSSISSLQSQINSLNSSSPTITNGVSRTISTSTTALGTLLSASSTSNVMYSVNIVTTASIGGSSAGEVFLEVSPTNTSTSTWTVVNRVKNSQTVTLALILNSVQDITYTIVGNIPAGYYSRLRSNNISGTPTYTFVTGQEMQF